MIDTSISWGRVPLATEDRGGSGCLHRSTANFGLDEHTKLCINLYMYLYKNIKKTFENVNKNAVGRAQDYRCTSIGRRRCVCVNMHILLHV